MSKSFHTCVCGAVAMLWIGCSKPETPRVAPGTNTADHQSHDAPRATTDTAENLTILYPPDGALFPPDIVAPTFRWEDRSPACNAWQVELRFEEGEPMEFRSDGCQWTPSDADWATIKDRSRRRRALVTIVADDPQEVAGHGRQAVVSFSTSDDAVEAPLFFREVNLPFLTAVKDPAAYIRWRFGPISSKEPPPIVLEKLPVCGNCHSFSANGSTLALEIDSGNDKGSYAIAPIESEIVLDDSKVVTWSDYRREDGAATFGLLCQVSPDGRYVVGTVKDRALAVYRDDLMFSQLFFLVKGILAIYDRQTKSIQALPGADDPRFVQTNATWSPDGKSIVFARSEVYEAEGVEDVKSVLVPQEAAKEFLDGKRTFRYDLYRIPFNDGKGGKAEPIAGASHNGMSNYFAKFSPDGKWIVFCKANSFMLLQPDSELHIIPVAGGEARRLECNTARMNSWHSWSPNGKWLVFSSKAYSAYTQLFLTHIDQDGKSSVPVVLSRFTEPERAANIPEFVNTAPDAIRQITQAFLDDVNYYRAAVEFIKQDDPKNAVPMLQKSLECNPLNTESRLQLAKILGEQGHSGDAKRHFTRLLELQPDNASAHQYLAILLFKELKAEEAAEHCRQALRVDPNLAQAHALLGAILLETGKLDEALPHLAEAARREPESEFSNFQYAHVLYRLGKPAEAVVYYERALSKNPAFVPALLDLASIRILKDQAELYDVDRAVTLAEKACEATQRKDAMALKTLAGAYAVRGRLADAVTASREALEIARTSGDHYLVQAIEKMLAIYEQLEAARRRG
ncbi:MAG: tetratricopeptide repeat protein [Rhodopirellula sp.]|nr:tetratricopeptide repeat protein [Rhodopirellula sp.]